QERSGHAPALGALDAAVDDQAIDGGTAERTDRRERAEAKASQSAVGVGGLQPQGVASSEHRQVKLQASLDGIAVLGVDEGAVDVTGKRVELLHGTRQLSRTPALVDADVRHDARHALTGEDIARAREHTEVLRATIF